VPLLEAGNKSGLKVSRTSGQRGFYVRFFAEREDPGNETVAGMTFPSHGRLRPRRHANGDSLYGSIFHRVVPVSSPAVAR